jgi:hypothetical protein
VKNPNILPSKPKKRREKWSHGKCHHKQAKEGARKVPIFKLAGVTSWNSRKKKQRYNL